MKTSAILLIFILAIVQPSEAGEPFAIEVVDSKTGRGVPLVELRTVNEIRFLTDSRGIVAFDEPGLMGHRVFFAVSSHGYDFPKDGFGFRGQAFDVVPGGRGRIKVDRINIAERLYRVTGEGIYRDSLLVGDRNQVPIRQPLLNAQVLGSDSVLNAVYQGEVHWFWGDTNRPAYPLGNFQSPTARSKLPTDGGLDIERGVDLDYAVDAQGFAAPSSPMPGEGPTWIDGLSVLKDRSGNERMFAAFAKIKPPMETYERGLAEFHPETRTFKKVASIPLDAPVYPTGHPFPHRVDGVDYLYFADAYPLVRVRADVDDLMHPDRFEAFTCLLPGSTIEKPAFDRNPEGTIRYAWRTGSRILDAQGQARLIKEGKISEDESLLSLRDVETGRRVTAHKGSTYWNEYRGRWVMVTVEIGGSSSFLGEVWYAEADTPVGPWVYARKVLTHNRYSFYNPKQHPMFAKENGRVIFFEGTYSTTFSGNPNPTPRYDYNQIMYKLDLGDPRLNLPVAVSESDGTLTLRSPGQPVMFFALDRPGRGTIPIGGFHALPPDLNEPPSTTVPLYEVSRNGSKTYSTTGDGGKPVARVWRNPMRMVLPPG
jgi:hypothetical protein